MIKCKNPSNEHTMSIVIDSLSSIEYDEENNFNIIAKVELSIADAEKELSKDDIIKILKDNTVDDKTIDLIFMGD